ncbi:threonine/serine dehydratase [Pseudomonas chlororaphis]|nr:threonine/serine dehydratase [Pseudomonas chlororaphis]
MSIFNMGLIRAAAEQLSSHVIKTPLLNSPVLDAWVGANVYVKSECLQRTGAFKIRGALFKMLSLSPQQRKSGVITYSAGNHGNAVSAASKVLGCSAVIVMPSDAPKIKQDNCRWWGAEIVLYDKQTQDREAVAATLIENRGLTFIPPFDDHFVMAGQGTVGVEISDQLQALGKEPDSLILGCSGGGLAAGVITAVHNDYPRTQCYLTEAEGYEKWALSFKSGRPEKLKILSPTIIDGIAGPSVGVKPFEVLKAKELHCTVASEEDVFVAMNAAYRHLKVVVEPGGAAALGVLIREKERFRGQNVVVVCSGGNVDPDMFVRALNYGSASSAVN